MTDRCPKCGRPMGDSADGPYCNRTYDIRCTIAEEGYRAGLTAGVELAKERASSTVEYIGSGEYAPGDVDWSDVDRELAERVGKP